MDFLKVLEESIKSIISKKGQGQAVKRTVDRLKDSGFPASQNKDNLIRALNKIIHEEEPEQRPIDLLTFTSRTAIKLTKAQADNLRKIRTAVEEAKVQEICIHKNIAMTGSLAGGGFTPMMPYAEVICRDCGVNVTFYHAKPKAYKEYGVEIKKSGIEDLKNWLDGDREGGDTRKNFALGEDVVKDPQGTLKKCTLWEGELPFKIVDPALFSARSGK